MAYLVHISDEDMDFIFDGPPDEYSWSVWADDVRDIIEEGLEK